MRMELESISLMDEDLEVLPLEPMLAPSRAPLSGTCCALTSLFLCVLSVDYTCLSSGRMQPHC